ncbi:site-specific tyrosine recombinase XerD [compost metagenome]
MNSFIHKNSDDMNYKYKFWLNGAKKEGVLYPLYFRILVNGNKTETQTSIMVKKGDWDEKKKQVKASNPNHELYNLTIEKQIEQFNEAVKYLIANDVDYDALDVKNQMKGKFKKKTNYHPKIESFEQVMVLVINKMIKEKKHKEGTIARYKQSGKLFSEFVKTVRFKDLDPDHAVDFENHLLSKKYEQNTVVRYVKHVKTILYTAAKAKFIPDNPIRLHTTRGMLKKPIKYLELEELKRIEKKQFEIDRLNKVRDIFLLQCYSGMAYADIIQFRIEDIAMIDGKYFITKQRKKTGQIFHLPLLNKARNLMEKYEWKLPNMSNQKMNAYLKEIGTLCGISTNLTTHIARKTFATLSLNNDVPVETVSKMIGHANVRMTLDAYAEIMPSKMIKDTMDMNNLF